MSDIIALSNRFAHEVNTPLAIIDLLTSRMQDKEIADKIQENSERISQVVKKIQELSKTNDSLQHAINMDIVNLHDSGKNSSKDLKAS